MIARRTAGSGLVVALIVVAAAGAVAGSDSIVETISYGPEPQQFGDLRIPVGDGPHPVAVVVHGGCWISKYDLRIMDAFSVKLTEAGFATWNIEYRRIGDEGGGWPGTFLDVALGIDHIRTLADDHDLDLDAVVVVGHSSGGHLALWSSVRHKIPVDSPIYQEDPLVPAGVVSLAGPPELRGLADLVDQVCREGLLAELLGGTPEEVPQNYEFTSPATLLPGGVPAIVAFGENDRAVPFELGQTYVNEAGEKGEQVELMVVPDAGHMTLIDPTSPTWPMIESAIKSLLIK